MTSPLSVPPSRELIVEHVKRHAAEHATTYERLTGEEIACPCGDTLVFLCGLCGWPIVVAARKGTYCEHARELYEDFGMM